MAHSKKNTVGRWAFLIGVVLAILLGFFGALNPTWLAVLVIIGLIVGLFNITEGETSPFLMSGTVLIIASAFGSSVIGQISVLGDILRALLAVFVPSTIIVAIKHVFSLARN